MAVRAESGAIRRRSPKHRIFRTVLQSVLLNGLLPLLLFAVGKAIVPVVPALIIAVAVPVCVNLVLSLRAWRVDVFGCFLLSGVLLSLVAVLLGGDTRLLLLRDAMVTSVMGMAMLISLLFPRPLIYYFAARFEAGSDPEALAHFAERWTRPLFRHTMYRLTATWGGVLVAEACIRGMLVFRLPPLTFLAISPLIQYGMLGGVICWTVWYVRRAKRHATE